MSKTRRGKRWKILVTPKEACKLISALPAFLRRQANFSPTFGRIAGKAKLINLLKNKDAAILDLERIDEEVLRNCPALKVISRFGEGCDAIDLNVAKKYKVRVVRTRGVASLAVARHALSLILALTHNIPENDRNLKKGAWLRKPNISEEETTVGILGFGFIGRNVARLCNDIGFKVVVCDLENISNTNYKYVRDPEKLADLSDILTLHLPLSKETRDIISTKIIGKLKGKYLVNSSRGGLVDEAALLSSLNDGGIAGYATDVFSFEPVSEISKKIAIHPKVICSPHIAAWDKVTALKMMSRATENAINSLRGMHNKVVSYIV